LNQESVMPLDAQRNLPPASLPVDCLSLRQSFTNTLEAFTLSESEAESGTPGLLALPSASLHYGLATSPVPQLHPLGSSSSTQAESVIASGAVALLASPAALVHTGLAVFCSSIPPP